MPSAVETKDKSKPKFSEETNLSEEERGYFKFYKERIVDLQESRKSQYGTDLDELWAQADAAYIPHRLGTSGKKVVATDEEKGWRGSLVQIGASDWQSDIAHNNPYIKIQTALSILIDQNPTGVFTPAGKKYEATTNLHKQLYQRSWEHAQSKQQLKLFVFNLAKYGWSIARTYPLRISRKVRELVSIDQENPSKNVYQEKEVVEFNDIFRENLDPRNCWIDDIARPNNKFSIRDWAWRKVYAFDAAEEEFGKYPNWKFVSPGGNVEDTINNNKNTKKDSQRRDKNLIEIFFYENRLKDLFMVVANGVPVVIEPLPISDSSGLKKLSCWQTYWTLRHAQCPYGIGIYEAMRFDQAMLDRFRNMTMDQLALSIYKMWFYQGTQTLTETGDIKIKPGIGKQVLDPKNVTFLEVPGPGNDAFSGIEMMRKDVDESSGIIQTLQGDTQEKTAYQSAVSRESALKRLKTPLDNILDALNEEGYITISLIQLVYSIPEIYEISDPELIDAYMNAVQSDPELYDRVQGENGEVFQAKVFPEFPINMETDEKGNLIETEQTKFFRVKPRFLKWEGTINIKAQSILTPSKEVNKAMELEFFNVLNPLLATLAQERQLALTIGENPILDNLPHGKAAKSLVKLYEKDPKDIFPQSWTEQPPPIEEPLIVPINQTTGTISGGGSPTVNRTPQVTPSQPTSFIRRAVNSLNPFKSNQP